MFENITARLSEIFKSLRRKGKLSKKDIENGLKDIRLALLEADVNYKVVIEFKQMADLGLLCSLGYRVQEKLLQL